MRKIKKKDMVGKTIKKIDNKSANVLKLEFTDGSKLELWTEHIGYGIYGIQVEDNPDS